MRQIILQQPGRFIRGESATPVPQPGEALVRIRRIGVCGTDLHAFAGRQPFFTYPRILGRYVREQKILSLEEAVRKMSGLAAESFGLKHFGRIEDGARANLVVFDPQRVSDQATFENSQQYPIGIEHVIVEGQSAIRYGESYNSGSGVAVKSQLDQ